MIGACPLEAAAAYAIGTLVSEGRDNVPMASPQLKARTARRVELCLQAIVLLALGVVISSAALGRKQQIWLAMVLIPIRRLFPGCLVPGTARG